jgi:two-component system OmpR family response regulator
MQILIVEDDARLSSALAHILKENHYQVDTVSDGATGLEWAASGIYDVVILDVMLPKMNGFDVVAELRRKGDSTPVLLLTARDSISDKITGLDSGADDYMTKPFSPTELMAHLRMLTRRQGEVVFEKLDFADLSLNLDSLEVSCRDKTIHLSVKEFSIAKILMTNPTQIASKEMLIDKVWGMDSNAEDNNVEAYISFLRKKLKFLGSRVQIETIRKVGYRLVDTGTSASKDTAARPA